VVGNLDCLPKDWLWGMAGHRLSASSSWPGLGPSPNLRADELKGASTLRRALTTSCMGMASKRGTPNGRDITWMRSSGSGCFSFRKYTGYCGSYSPGPGRSLSWIAMFKIDRRGTYSFDFFFSLSDIPGRL
jgi:hypothetical protein